MLSTNVFKFINIKNFITKLIDKTFDNSFVGNAIFWSAFCVVGQPMGIILVNYDLFKWANNNK